jgi:hypothetical protein
MAQSMSINTQAAKEKMERERRAQIQQAKKNINNRNMPELSVSPPGTGDRARPKRQPDTQGMQGINTPSNKVPDHSKLRTIDEENDS